MASHVRCGSDSLALTVFSRLTHASSLESSSLHPVVDFACIAKFTVFWHQQLSKSSNNRALAADGPFGETVVQNHQQVAKHVVFKSSYVSFLTPREIFDMDRRRAFMFSETFYMSSALVAFFPRPRTVFAPPRPLRLFLLGASNSLPLPSSPASS